MNAPDTNFLADVQSTNDSRNLAIQQVGVKSLRLPVTLATPHGPQPSVASLDLYVALPADQKGTHMSRFIEVLQAHHQPLSPLSMQALMQAMLVRLEAQAGYIEARMPYFVRKRAPVSGVESLMDYEVTLRAEMPRGAAQPKLTQQVLVPVLSLCPCSKKIADYGAHNQRSHITIAVELDGELTLDEQIRFAETAGSSEVWALLKRPDEKFLTEQSYDNPKFVEDIVRDVAVALNADSRVLAYTVECENFESIHNHSAYARITHDKRATQPA